MSINQPTPNDVRAFALFMAKKYKFTIVPLDNAPIKIAKKLLKLRGIDIDAFLPFVGITLPYQGQVYVCLNFEVGDLSKVSLASQIETIVHESMHAIQAGKKGYKTYYAQYVLSGPKRAVMEAQAFAMGDGLRYKISGRLSSEQAMTNYLLSDKSAKLAEAAYKKIMDMIVERGMVKKHPLGVALGWLKDREGLV